MAWTDTLLRFWRGDEAAAAIEAPPALPARSGLRVDNWANTLTGLGLPATDKQMSHTPQPVRALPDQTLENMYNGEGISARIIDLPIDDAMRQGSTPAAPPDTDEAVVQSVADAWKDLGCWSAIQRGDRWGRLYGRSAILVGTDDGLMDEPLVPERVKTIRYLMVLEASEFTPRTYYTDPDQPKYGEPETYAVTTTIGTGAMTELVHESRLILFGGAPTSRKVRVGLGWRDYSILQRAFDALRRFDSDWASASAMMTDGSIGVLKIKEFADVVAGGSKDTFETRIQLMNLGLSVSRTLPIDADTEDYSRVERTFAGVDGILDKSALYLAATIGWPVTRLLGMSPAGLSATGESDERHWYDLVQAHRDTVTRPAAETLQGLVLWSLGIDPAGWGVDLPALVQESDADEAARRKTEADTDAIYLDRGVVQPEAVAIARFGQGDWSDRVPEVDIEAAEALLGMDKKRALGGGGDADNNE